MERAEQLAIGTAAGVPRDYLFLSSSLTLHRKSLQLATLVTRPFALTRQTHANVHAVCMPLKYYLLLVTTSVF
jgi:hypothetical protein